VSVSMVIFPTCVTTGQLSYIGHSI